MTRFKAGDRVIGHAVGTDKDVNSAAEGAFQHYTVLLERMTCPIPDSLAFSDAVVLPLAVSTAACGLFQDEHLRLAHPNMSPTRTGETVLVWGGATSVGTQAIQLARAAGYDVITTCSPHNFDYVRSLGAEQTFDYHSPTVIADLTQAVATRTVAGAIAFGTTSAHACVRVLARSHGRKFLALATPPVAFDTLAPESKKRFTMLGVIVRMITSNIRLHVLARSRGVGLKYIFGTSLKHNTISTVIYRDFLPTALAHGRYTTAPTPRIVGHSLDDLQNALDEQRRGVSAAKIVVTLPVDDATAMTQRIH